MINYFLIEVSKEHLQKCFIISYDGSWCTYHEKMFDEFFRGQN